MAKNITKLKHRTPFKQILHFPKVVLKLFKHHWPVLVLVSITLLICFLNFEPNTFFIGWDNLPAEFNPKINITRSLFTVWQEYQSLGLLGGMSHAADLIRQIAIYLISLTSIPLSSIRYIFIFLPLFFGPLGVLFFLDRFVFSDRLGTQVSQFAAFIGALFYLLNLGTVQTFFTPFETFVYFYGFFPWLLFFLLRFIHQPRFKTFSVLLLFSVLATPSFYIETLFVVFFLSILPFFIENILREKYRLKATWITLLAFTNIFLANSFWLLPVAFFVITGGHVGELSKINTISTPEIYYRNLEFRSPLDLGLLKGFWFNFVDLSGSNNKFEFLLTVWRNHLTTPTVSLISYLLLSITLIGAFYSIKKRFPWSYATLAMAGICIFFLAGGGLFINSQIPLIGELFRSPFTKFSTPLIFAYAYFFATGSIFILDIFTFLHSRLTYPITLFTISLAIFLFISPVFSGQLVSPSMRRDIPPEYFELFDYFNQQNPATRIANFPQNNFWGWLYYDWGYRGSGFLWYGIKQPILDRAFDVWSKTSENYYEEISSALYSEDTLLFQSLLKKYSVDWILLDKHVIAPDGISDMGNAKLEKILAKTSFAHLTKKFGDKISLYRLDSDVKNFLDTTQIKVDVTPFSPLNLRPDTSWNISSDSISPRVITFQNHNQYHLQLPSLTDSEALLPVTVSYKKVGPFLVLKLVTDTPSVTINGTSSTFTTVPVITSFPLPTNNGSFVLQIDTQYFELEIPSEIENFNDYYPLTSLYLPTKNSISLKLYNGSFTQEISLDNVLKNATPKQCFVQKPNRKIEKITTSEGISLLGTDVVGCLSTPLPNQYIDGVFSYTFSYSSPTFTLGNANITNAALGAQDISQPLEPQAKPKRVRLFASTNLEPQQFNLILEANETKSIQEIHYSNIHLYFHPLISSSTFRLNPIDHQDIVLPSGDIALGFNLPKTDTIYNITQTPGSNQLFPENRNCDQFNKGDFIKTASPDGFQYQSKNAIECDFLNLRHFPHGLNYLISLDYQYQKGLPMTLCFENFSTRRCDIFERLTKTDSLQSVVNPISNSQETPGYTLHLFNQSVGNLETKNLLRSVSLNPIPLNFLKDITLASPITSESIIQPFQSTHPNEFLYTVSGNASNADTLLNLYQSRSPYWKAFLTLSSDLKASPLELILKSPFLYLVSPKLTPFDLPQNWYNSWALPKGDYTVIIVYLPQYLEFLGFVLLISTIIILIIALSYRKFSTNSAPLPSRNIFKIISRVPKIKLFKTRQSRFGQKKSLKK